MLSRNESTSRPFFSSFALFAILIYFLITFFSVGKWQEDKIIEHDGSIYYVYLPATFIYNDLSFAYRDSLNKSLKGYRVSGFLNDDGRLCQKMTVGKAIMDTPFFLMAHLWAQLDDRYETHGYDSIYHLFIGLSGLSYAFFALLYIRKILRQLVPDIIVAITIILIGCATNLFYYATYSGAVAHLSGLFLISFFIWHSMRYVDKKNHLSLILAMLSLGLSVIVRPTNAIFGLFLLLYIFESGVSFRKLTRDISGNPFRYILSIIAFAIPIFIQLCIWKYTSGYWIQYGYGEEGFFFGDPKILKGLFSARNGLFLYAPILIFAIAGMLLPRLRKFKLSLILPFGIFIYVIYSWWSWWYGGSLGSRAAIEGFVILSIFLATFLHFISRKLTIKWKITVLLIPVVFTIYLTRSQAHQTHAGILHWDSMTYSSYWDIFPNSHIQNDFADMLEAPDYVNALESGKEYVGFEKLTKHNRLSKKVEIDGTLALADDSLHIKCTIWDGNKFINDKEFIKLLVCPSGGSVCDTLSIRPEKRSRFWNEINVHYVVPKELQNSSFSLRYLYLGKTRCFYKNPSILEQE